MLDIIDPIAFTLFGQAITWYWLFYPISFLTIFYLSRHYIYKNKIAIKHSLLIDFFIYLWLSMILGARIGYFLIYQPKLLISEPLVLLSLELGGMSFHGAAIGLAIFLFAYQKLTKFPVFRIYDIVILFAPIALFLGRIGNFINGELWGRPSDLPWAIVISSVDGLSRHPSQLYQAIAEGPVLMLLLFIFKKNYIQMYNTILFLCLYSSLRFFTEFFREPDAHLGLIWQVLTYGQMLSIAIMLPSLFYLYRTKNKLADS